MLSENRGLQSADPKPLWHLKQLSCDQSCFVCVSTYPLGSRLETGSPGVVLCGLTNVTLLAQLWSAILLVFEATLSYQDISSVNAF